MDSYEEQASLLKAIAHPARLRILQILAREECCVCHLTAALRLRQPCVSQHLMVLRDKGLVLDRRDGVMVYYCLANHRVAEVVSLTRDLVSASEGVQTHAEWPVEEPVRGCSCPKCEEKREKGVSTQTCLQVAG
jgi:DNA-binding transcriptional ArsR family regulator